VITVNISDPSSTGIACFNTIENNMENDKRAKAREMRFNRRPTAIRNQSQKRLGT
jgi:hypothetical protein